MVVWKRILVSALVAMPLGAQAEYQMLKAGTGLCLELQNGATARGTPVVLAACSGAARQLWEMDAKSRLVPKSAVGTCLQTGTWPTNGNPATIQSCQSQSYQQWRWDGKVLRNVRSSDFVLDHNVSNNQAAVWSYHGGINQQWQWVAPGGGTTTPPPTTNVRRSGFTNETTTLSTAELFTQSHASYVWKLLSRPSASTAVLSAASGTVNNLMAEVDGDYVLEVTANNASGVAQARVVLTLTARGDSLVTDGFAKSLCLTVKDPLFTGGQSAVVPAPCVNDAPQRWTLDGAGQWHAAANHGYCLDGGTLASMSAISAKPCLMTNGQRWQYTARALRLIADTSKAIEITSDGDSVRLYSFQDGYYQHWYRTRDAVKTAQQNASLAVNFPISITDTTAIAVDEARNLANRLTPFTDPLPAPRDVTAFPGVVAATAPRVSQNFSFALSHPNGDYLRVSVPTRNWQSTGLYAPPGEAFTVSVSGAKSSDLEGAYLLVGEQTDMLRVTSANVIQDKQFKRFPNASTWLPLRPGSQKLRSQYGGLIVLVAPRNVGVTAQITVSGAVQAPFFRLGQTSVTDWQSRRNAPGPWAVLEGNRTSITVPSAQVRTIADPTAMMQDYDRIIALHEQLSGLRADDTDSRHRPQGGRQRLVSDVQIVNGYAHAGYPLMFNPELNLADALLPKSSWAIWHELGHNYQQRSVWASAFSTESTVNLFSLHAQEVLQNRSSLVTNKRYSAAIAKLNNTTITDKWVNADVWDKLVFLMQIKEAVPAKGWGVYQELHRYYRGLTTTEINAIAASQQKQFDTFYIQMSRISGYDLTAHFQTWTVPVSATAVQTVKAMGLPSPASPISLINME